MLLAGNRTHGRKKKVFEEVLAWEEGAELVQRAAQRREVSSASLFSPGKGVPAGRNGS